MPSSVRVLADERPARGRLDDMLWPHRRAFGERLGDLAAVQASVSLSG